MSNFDFMLVLPVIALAAYGLLGLLLAPFPRWSGTRMLGAVGLTGIGVAAASLYVLWRQWAATGPLTTAFGMVQIDGLALFVSFLLLLVGALTVLYSIGFLEREDADLPEFCPLVLLCLAGMLMMLHTTNLLMVLVGLEVFSLALYVITGLTRMRLRAIEAALKYFLLGAFSSGFLVYGLALLYGATGTLDMRAIGERAAAAPSPMLWIGLGLLLIGLAFKIGAVPFHQWVPDVYQGAPTNVTGFMAAATKTAVFAVLLRVLFGAFGARSDVWVPLVTGLAIATMTVANLIALAQTNLKRLLAYSSIAHAGYLLIAVASGPDDGVRAVLFYLTAYSFMTVGAFAVLAAAGRGGVESERGYELVDWHGMGWRRPLLGFAMAFFLFSLAGMPPTGGFLGKYVVFEAAIRSEHYLLAVVGMLNAGVAAYYYLRVVVAMYMREPEGDELPLPLTPTMATVMLVSILGVMYLGLAPGKLLDLVRGLASSLT